MVALQSPATPPPTGGACKCGTSAGRIKRSQVNVEPSAVPLRLVAAVLAASQRSSYREKRHDAALKRFHSQESEVCFVDAAL